MFVGVRVFVGVGVGVSAGVFVIVGVRVGVGDCGTGVYVGPRSNARLLYIAEFGVCAGILTCTISV